MQDGVSLCGEVVLTHSTAILEGNPKNPREIAAGGIAISANYASSRR